MLINQVVVHVKSFTLFVVTFCSGLVLLALHSHSPEFLQNSTVSHVQGKFQMYKCNINIPISSVRVFGFKNNNLNVQYLVYIFAILYSQNYRVIARN